MTVTQVAPAGRQMPGRHRYGHARTFTEWAAQESAHAQLERAHVAGDGPHHAAVTA